jgi:hypothetical protein
MTSLTDQIGFFTAMPETIIKLWPQIGTDAVALFLYLRYRTNRERGVAFPSYDTIATDTGWGRRRISEAIKVLSDEQLVVRRKRFGSSTEYALQGRQLPLPLPPASDSSSRAPELLQSRSAPTIVAERDLTQIESSDSSVKGRHLPTHPAIVLCRHYCERYPSRAWRDEIIAAVGSDPAQVSKWEFVLKEWTGRGHNRTGWSNMLDVFKNGWTRSNNGNKPRSSAPHDPAADVARFNARRPAAAAAHTKEPA